jgi:hypothetical protein
MGQYASLRSPAFSSMASHSDNEMMVVGTCLGPSVIPKRCAKVGCSCCLCAEDKKYPQHAQVVDPGSLSNSQDKQRMVSALDTVAYCCVCDDEEEEDPTIPGAEFDTLLLVVWLLA